MTKTDASESETLYRALFDLRANAYSDRQFLNIWARAARLPQDGINARILVGMLHKSGDLLERGTIRLAHGERQFLTPILRIWENRLTARMKKFDAEKLARILISFRAMSVVPTAGFLQEFHARFDAASPNIYHSVNTFAALADLGLPADDRLLTRVLATTATASETQIQHYGAIILRAAGLLDSQNPSPLLKEIAQNCLDRIRIRDNLPTLGENAQFMTRYACLWFGLDLPQGLIEKHPKPMTVSGYENTVRDMLGHAGFTILPQTAAYFPELDKETDFAIQTPDGIVHIELDGPYHFTYPLQGRTEQYNGSTLFMTALLGKLHPDTAFIRLPFFNLDNLQRKEPQRIGTILAKQFSDAATRAAAGKTATFILAINNNTPNLRVLRKPPAP